MFRPCERFNKALVLASLLVIPASRATAIDVVAAAGGKVVLGGFVDKDDFHIKIKSDVGMTTTKIFLHLNGELVPVHAVGGNGTEAITLDWEFSQSVSPGAVVTWSVVVTEPEYNRVEVVDQYFTPHLSPTDVPALGWDVRPSGDVFLLNSFPVAVHFDDLFFQRPAELTEVTILTLLDAPPAGMTGFVTSGDMPAAAGGVASSLLVGHFDVPPLEYLTARMDLEFLDPNFSTNVSVGALGHQSVPEPSAFALAGSGGVALIAYGLRRRRGGTRERAA